MAPEKGVEEQPCDPTAVLSISWRTSSAPLWTKLSEHQPSIRSTDCDLRCWILIRTLGPIRNPLELNNVKVCLCEDKECICYGNQARVAPHKLRV